MKSNTEVSCSINNFNCLLHGWGHICDSAHLTLSRVCWHPTEVDPGILLFTGISFCRMSALLVFPHERVQMFLKTSCGGLTWSKMLREKGWSLRGAVMASQGEAAGSIRLCSYWNWAVLQETDSLLFLLDQRTKCSAALLKFWDSNVTMTRMLLENLFPWNVTKMFLEVCGTETWMGERWVQRSWEM